jgi:hypothetical protein
LVQWCCLIALRQNNSSMANQLERQKDWSSLCEACLLRTKSPLFREAALDPGRPLKYEMSKLVSECVLCSLVARQLDYREPGSSSTFTVTAVSISRGSEPSTLYLSVDNYHSLYLWLLTRPGKIALT